MTHRTDHTARVTYIGSPPINLTERDTRYVHRVLSNHAGPSAALKAAARRRVVNGNAVHHPDPIARRFDWWEFAGMVALLSSAALTLALLAWVLP